MALPLAASSRLGCSTQWPSQQQQHLHLHQQSCLLQLNRGQHRAISSPCMAFWSKGFGRGRSGSAAGLHSRGYAPQLSASEISRGLTSNADLHLRQHYDEHIAWDADKEESRVWRRTMYTFPDWKKHRSSYRYVHHMHTILESRIVRGLLRPVLVITLAAAGEPGNCRQ
ncbi:hypothetical protein COO60DRAFT_1011475 [Scenedesmus sp. NREL 46B-D3]|nr:hypothetical protein COO60DRAFT_1011475 [Scenedesmus sp. NREL 46B-D3]